MRLHWHTELHGYVLRGGDGIVHAMIVKRKDGYYADCIRLTTHPSGPYKRQTQAAQFVQSMLRLKGVEGEFGEFPYRRGEAHGIKVSHGQTLELRAA